MDDVIKRADAVAAIEAMRDADLNHVAHSSDTIASALAAINAIPSHAEATEAALAVAREALENAPIIGRREGPEEFKARQDEWLKTEYRNALAQLTEV